MSESNLSSQLDYKKETYVHPSYRLNKVLPQSGTQTFTLTPAGGNDTIFEIPAYVFNPAKSFTQFNIAPSVNGGNFYYAYKDEITPIRQLQVYTRAGLYLCDLNEVANYTRVVWKSAIPMQEYLEYDNFLTGSGQGRYLTSINAITGTGQRVDNTAVKTSYLEPAYIESGNNASQTPTYQIIVDNSMLANTFLALDKDILANEILIMRIVWNPTTKMYYNTTSAVNPTTGPTTFAGNVTISNLALFLAVEKNKDIENQLRTQIATGGISILIPYVYTYKTNLGPSSSQTVSLRFNRGHGMRLLKIYHSLFNNNESIATSLDNAAANAFTYGSAYDNDNSPNTIAGDGNSLKLQYFYTMLDNERLQEFNLSCKNLDDYMLMKNKLRGSITQTSSMYYYNWHWIEDFSAIENDNKNKQNLESGLDLTTEHKWDFYAYQVSTISPASGAGVTYSKASANANSGQYNHYTFAITQKLLTITPSGITVI